MANVQSLTARFVAQASGFKSTVQGMTKDLKKLQISSQKTTKGMSSGFQNFQQNIQSNMNKAADGLTNFGNGLGNASKKVEDVGWSLTKKLTVPAGIAVGAVGALVAKMGWDRLKSIDEAKAQLEGLGYSAKEQESIIATTTKAIEGGMTTMGEGIMIAAGGLAAGVEEGKDLEKYIRLVGDAATGSKRPVDEMAQIFNRVVGGGKLMTRELNMIEHGMPGFSKEMALHLGVSQEAFREMVTDGKVSSDDFLIVMDDFAGGMAAAYADTWSGMVENTKAYISILGASLMGGVFEKSKKSLREFIDLISSEEIQKKATEMGESLGKSFTKIVDGAVKVVKWFANLNQGTQKIILGFATFMVALGPALILIGRVGGGIASLSRGMGHLTRFLAKAITPIKSLSASTGIAGKSFALMSKPVAFLGTTLGVVIGWVALFVAAIIGAYKYSEPFRDSIKNLGGAFKNLWNKITDILSPLKTTSEGFWSFGDIVKNLWTGIKNLAEVISRVLGAAFSLIINYVSFVVNGFAAMLAGVDSFVQGVKRLFAGDFKGAMNFFKESVRKTVGAVKDVWQNLFKAMWKSTKNGFNNILVPFAKGLGSLISKVASWSGNLVKKFAVGLGRVTVKIAKEIPDWVVAFTKGLGNIIITVSKWSADLIKKMVGGLGRVTIQIAKKIPGWVVAFNVGLRDIIIAVAKWSGNLVKKFVGGLGRVTIAIAKEIPGWIVAFNIGLRNIIIAVAKWTGNLVKKFAVGLGRVTSRIIKSIPEWVVAFVKGLGRITLSIGKWLLGLPKQIVKGIGAVTIWIVSSLAKWTLAFVKGLGAITIAVAKWAYDKLPEKVKEGLKRTVVVIGKTLVEWKDKFKEKTKEITTDVYNWALDLPGKIKDGLTNAKDGFVDWFKTTRKNNKEKTEEMTEKFKTWAKELPGKIGESLGNGADVFDKWLKDQHEQNKEFYLGLPIKAAKWLGGKAKEIGKGLAKWGVEFSEFFGALPGKIGKKASEMYGTFSDKFLNKGEDISEKLAGWGESITNWFGEMPENIGKKSSEMFGRFYDGFLDKKDAIIEGLGNWGTGIKEWFTGTGDDVEVESDGLGTRFKDGIVNAKDKVIDSFTSWKDGIVEWFEELGETKEIKEAGKKTLETFGDGLDDKETKGDMMSRISQFVLKIPGYVLAAIGISFFALGRELILMMVEGLTEGYEHLKLAWSDIKEIFASNSDEIRERLNSNWLGKMILDISAWGYDSEDEFEDIWADIADVFTQNTRTIRERLESNFLGRMILAIYEWDIKQPFKDAWADVKDVFTQEQRTTRERLESNFLGRIILAVYDWDLKKPFKDAWAKVKELFESDTRTIRERLESNFLGRMILAVYAWDIKKPFKDAWADVKDVFTQENRTIRERLESNFLGRMLLSIYDWGSNVKKSFSKMWADVKRNFKQKMGEIYVELKNSWLGKMISRIYEFSKDFKKNMRLLWEDIKRRFKMKMNEIYQMLRKSWLGKMIARIYDFSKDFKKNIRLLWEDIKRRFRIKMNEIYQMLKKSWLGKMITSIIGFGKNFKKNISKMWNDIKRNFRLKIDEIYGSIKNSFVGRMLKSIRGLKDNFIKIAKDMWDGVKKQFNNIVTGAKNLPGRIGKGIRKAKDKAISGMTSVGKGIISAFGKPIRGVKAGINWVLGKFGAPKIKGTWGMKNVYAKGTKRGGHPGGLALVGDGKGTNAGEELITPPGAKSTQFLSPNVPTMMNLPKGTSVLSATDTRDILGNAPKYAMGTDDAFGMGGRSDDLKKAYGTEAKEKRTANTKRGIKAGRAKTKKAFGDIWDYIKKPKTLLGRALGAKGIGKPDGPGWDMRVARGGFKKAKEAAIEKIKDIFIEQEHQGGARPDFGWPITSPFGYRTHPITGRKTLHAGIDFGAPGGTPIPSQTGGNVSFSGWGGGYGNLVKVRSGMLEMLYGHMSKRLVKQGQSVNPGKILGRVGTTGNSTGNHLHYEVRKGGKPVNPMKQGHSASGNVSQWISRAISATRAPKGWQSALETIAMKESGGKTGPSTVNNWDSNARRGTPSMGLMQTIKPTFDAFKQKGMNSIMNPVHNAAAAIRYIKSRYGSPYNTPGLRSMKNGGPYLGYENGGIVNQKQLAWIADGGWAESIISHDPNKAVSQEKIWNDTGHKLGFKDGAIDKDIIEALERIAVAVEKDQDIEFNLDGRKLADIIEPRVTQKQQRKASRKRGVR